ncbi:MAG: DUF2203 domain-containing protein [Polyangiales bacterium]
MSEKVRIFTVAEANALLPKLNVMLERQMSMLRDVDALAEEMTALGMDPQLLDADPGSTPEREALKARMREAVRAFHTGWREVEATGAVVKDYRQGLVDFYGRRGPDTVWLCWKYGEPAVAHWHPLDTGFAARRPLERNSIPPTLN